MSDVYIKNGSFNRYQLLQMSYITNTLNEATSFFSPTNKELPCTMTSDEICQPNLFALSVRLLGLVDLFIVHYLRHFFFL